MCPPCMKLQLGYLSYGTTSSERCDMLSGFYETTVVDVMIDGNRNFPERKKKKKKKKEKNPNKLEQAQKSLEKAHKT